MCHGQPNITYDFANNFDSNWKIGSFRCQIVQSQYGEAFMDIGKVDSLSTELPVSNTENHQTKTQSRLSHI